MLNYIFLQEFMLNQQKYHINFFHFLDLIAKVGHSMSRMH